MDDRWKILLRYARRQLRAANLPNDAWSLGGGTALMLNFQHRYSKDIDIFFTDPQYLAFLSPRLNDGTDDSIDDYIEQANFIKLHFPEGEVDFISARPITSYTPCILQQLPDIMTEHPVEIIAKKIIYRSESFKPRDVFDLSTVFNYCRDEMQETCLLFAPAIDNLQARIQFLNDSGRLEAEINAIDLVHKEVHAAGHYFAACQAFFDTVREAVEHQENKAHSPDTPRHRSRLF
jgi:hypothetical protein